MTLPTNVKKFLKERYKAMCFILSGMKAMKRKGIMKNVTVCIQDVMLDIHGVTKRILESRAKERLFHIESLQLSADNFRNNDHDLTDLRPMWIDVLLFIMRTANNFYRDEDDDDDNNQKIKTFVMLFDRGCPPAKYLKHRERYETKERNIADHLILKSREEAEKLFDSKYIPAEFDQYMKQKLFVDMMIKKVSQLIIKFYSPPPEQHFILDGPGQIRLVWKNNKISEITEPSLINHCLESDLSIVFWCNVFKQKNIKVVTSDGDVLLALLQYTKYRISSVRKSKQGIENLYDFKFSNNIYLQQSSKTIYEDEEQQITKLYERLCKEFNPNEMNSTGKEKESYMSEFDARLELQALLEEASKNEAMERKSSKEVSTDVELDPQDFNPEMYTEEMRNSLPLLTRNLIFGGGNLMGDSNNNSHVISKKKNDITDNQNLASASILTLNGQSNIDFDNCEELLQSLNNKSNEYLSLTSDITFVNAKKLFKLYEIVDINNLYQQIVDDLMAGFDHKTKPIDAEFFKPIESLLLACKICGDDYVKKLPKIGEKFILSSFYQFINKNGLLLYTKKIDTKKYTKHSLDSKKVDKVIFQFKNNTDNFNTVQQKKSKKRKYEREDRTVSNSESLALRQLSDDDSEKTIDMEDENSEKTIDMEDENSEKNIDMEDDDSEKTIDMEDHATENPTKKAKKNIEKSENNQNKIIRIINTNNIDQETEKEENFIQNEEFSSSMLKIDKKKEKSSEEQRKALDTLLVQDLEREYNQYERMIIDHESVYNLLYNAFVLKKSKQINFTKEQVKGICANTLFSINYFGNDYKPHTSTDCLEKHLGKTGCGKSIYGFIVPNERERPSRTNIERTDDICDCFVVKIRNSYKRMIEHRLNIK